MKQNYEHVSILLDKSGSMNAIKMDVIGGFNQFIEDQKKHPGDMTVTLMAFSSSGDVDTIYDRVPVHNVQPLSVENYKPAGQTALFDSFVYLIEDTGKELAKMSDQDRPEKVLIVCITDGGENDSRKHTAKDLADRVKHQQEAYKWEFSYIGANQDAFAVGTSIGITHNTTYKSTSRGVKNTFASLSTSNVKYRSAESESFSMPDNIDDK